MQRRLFSARIMAFLKKIFPAILRSFAFVLAAVILVMPCLIDWRLPCLIFIKLFKRDNHVLKYARKSNQNRSISKLRSRFWHVLLQSDPLLRESMMKQLCADIARRPVEIRPGRSPNRKRPRKKRFYASKKSVLP